MKNLPTEHDMQMRSILSIGPDDKIPDEIVETYWRVKKMADRVSAPKLDANQLAFIVLLSGKYSVRSDVAPQEPQHGVDWKSVQVGTPVETEEGRKGRLLKVESGGRIQVEIEDDDAAFRRFSSDELKVVN